MRPDGTTTHVAADMVLVAETADEPQFFSLQLRDTTHEARREGLEKGRVAIRDRIDQGQPLKGTLEEVCRLVESQLDWALGVVMRVRGRGARARGRRPRAAPARGHAAIRAR